MKIANLLTSFRIVCSILLLFCPAFSYRFYALYIVAGITDMADGFAARITNSASESGARFDTLADFIFTVICLIKLLPVMPVKKWMCVFIALIFFIKFVNIVSGCAIQKKFVSLHTPANKIAGFMLFLLPLTLKFIPLKYSAAVVCCITAFAAVQEGHYIRKQKNISQ